MSSFNYIFLERKYFFIILKCRLFIDEIWNCGIVNHFKTRVIISYIPKNMKCSKYAVCALTLFTLII